METRSPRHWLFPGAMALVLAGCLLQALRPAPSSAPRTALPAPTPAAPAPVPAGHEQATLAGGCFWSMEAIFKQLKGVDRAEPGYSGGRVPKPSYEQVETGETGHAESIQITFDPKVIAYHELLQVFFTMRNPTTPNRQGNDVGPQYRSVIFYRNARQKQEAQQEIQEIAREHLWHGPIVTQLVPFTHFYRAEYYHLDYYRLHPDEPYCRYVIAPEIAEFHARFKNLLKP